MIEDDLQDVEIVRDLLINKRPLTITIEHCETLNAGIRRLKNNHPAIHIALLDLGLPDAQGLTGFMQIHQNFPELPLIILSGNTDDTLALEAVQKGAQDYLVKGQFNSNMLQRSIYYAIERQQHLLELKDDTQRLQHLSSSFR